MENKLPGKDFRQALLSHKQWLKVGGFSLIMASLLVMVPFLNINYVYYISIGFFLASLVMFIHAFKFWLHKWTGFSLYIAAGCVDVFISITYILYYPQLFVICWWLLGILFLIMGLSRIYTATTQGILYLGWKWMLFCGFINLLLAALLLFQVSSSYVLIPLTGSIDFLFAGIALMRLGAGAHQLEKEINENLAL